MWKVRLFIFPFMLPAAPVIKLGDDHRNHLAATLGIRISPWVKPFNFALESEVYRVYTNVGFTVDEGERTLRPFPRYK